MMDEIGKVKGVKSTISMGSPARPDHSGIHDPGKSPKHAAER